MRTHWAIVLGLVSCDRRLGKSARGLRAWWVCELSRVDICVEQAVIDVGETRVVVRKAWLDIERLVFSKSRR